jgi:2,4-dienoyl-CoA reductase-like NADH-dependent reductase (Old Yellow Enzyme family)
MDLQALTTRRKVIAAAAAAGAFSRLGAGVSAAGAPRSSYRLFSDGRIAGLRLKNRLARSATAENAWRGDEISGEGLNLYRSLAAGGVGLIITGHMAVAPAGRANDWQTRIDQDGAIASLRKLSGVVHATDKECKVVAQVSHAGMQGQASERVGPSTTGWPRLKAPPRALTPKEVEEIAASFAQAVRRAQNAGFDGAQLHAAHGYLLSSFLSPYTNTRQDRYGGSLEKRVAIVREIIERARLLVGPGFPILIKVNCDDQAQGGIDIGNFPQLAKELERAGAQALEISGNNPIRENISSPEEQSYFAKYAKELDLKIPVILTGGNRSVERLEQLATAGVAQFLGFARPLLREPDLPARWLEGRGTPEAACISCNRCIRGYAKGMVTRCRVNEPDV